MSEPFIVYFSSVTENTKRFVEKLDIPSVRIPVYRKDDPLSVDREYVLILPTYGGGGVAGSVPKQVIKFLNDENNRSHCVGVVASGNTNFGEGYLLAGKIVQEKLNVPFLGGFELMGMPGDHERIAAKIRESFN